MDVATETAKQWVPTWKKLECPDIRERGCHSTVLMGDLLITFGGWDGATYFNDIIALDLKDMKWQKAVIVGDDIIPRYTHSSNIFQEDKIVVVGGYSDKYGVLNETAVLSLVSREPLTFMWKILDMKAGEKLYRSDHTANIYGNYLYMFGGADKREESVDELWLLSLGNSKVYEDKFTWTRLSTSSDVKPGDRYGHCSVLYQEALYVFGGFSTVIGKVLDDLWILSLRELKWQKIDTSYYNGPSGRTSASVQEVDGKLILFGGYNGVYSNELFSYDISTQTWEKLKTKGELPRGRAYHTAVYYQGQYIVWGGEIAHQRCIYSLHACQLAEPKETPAIKRINESFSKEKKALKTIETIFNNNFFADVVFEVEEQEIPAHRAILAGGSQHFLNLFEKEMNTSEKIKIKVSDVKIASFKAFLRFMYCQDIELGYSLAIDLLGVAEQYSASELKNLCEDYLSKGLNQENISELINVAECFDAVNLKYAIAKFKEKSVKL